MFASTLSSTIGRQQRRSLLILTGRIFSYHRNERSGVVRVEDKGWLSTDSKKILSSYPGHNVDTTAAVGHDMVVDAWLETARDDSVVEDNKVLLGREDAALEHSTRLILDLLLQESKSSPSPHFSSFWNEDLITTERCHVGLNMLLYQYDPSVTNQHLRRRDKLVPGSAKRAYDIWKAMCHSNVSVQVNELTTRLVLQILARDNHPHPNNNIQNNSTCALEVVQYYSQHHKPTNDDEREERQLRWMYNQILACHANSNAWDKSYHAMKLFTKHMVPNVDASSYSHVLRACATSSNHPKSLYLGRKIALQLWEQHIQNKSDPPKLSPHVYRFLIQTLAITTADGSGKHSKSPKGRNNNENNIPIIFQHCCNAGMINSHVLLILIKHADLFDFHDSPVKNYLDKFKDKSVPPHRRASALFRILPKNWTQNANSNASGW